MENVHNNNSTESLFGWSVPPPIFWVSDNLLWASKVASQTMAPVISFNWWRDQLLGGKKCQDRLRNFSKHSSSICSVRSSRSHPCQARDQMLVLVCACKSAGLLFLGRSEWLYLSSFVGYRCGVFIRLNYHLQTLFPGYITQLLSL